jgi:fibrillarin-like pre-rRNA processing protein
MRKSFRENKRKNKENNGNKSFVKNDSINTSFKLKKRDDRRSDKNNSSNNKDKYNKKRFNKFNSNNSKPAPKFKNNMKFIENIASGFNEYRLKGVFYLKSNKGISFYTKNFVPNEIVYDEKLVFFENIEYREWNPKKSKLGAAIYNGCSQIGIKPGSTVLYLGCSTGTTCSHVSDIIGNDGFLFGLDVAPRVMREFVFLCEKRKNMAPLLKDAHFPERFTKIVPKVDVIFQDIAQRDQVDIFIKNCNTFLKETGTGMLALKARSIDVTKKPKEIFEEVRKILDEKMSIVDSRTLEPFEKDHHFFVVKLKNSI